MTTHENFLSNCETCERIMYIGDDVWPRNLISVPMFHVTGCNSQLLITMMLGGTTVIMPAFDVQTMLHAVQDERINLLTTVPAIYWLAVNQPNFGDFDVSGVNWCAYGGAPTAPDVIAKLRASFPNARLGNGFGLSRRRRCRRSYPTSTARRGRRRWASPLPSSSSTWPRSTRTRVSASC